jgi:HNH endonuclease
VRVELADDLVETAVRLEALEDWTAVVQEDTCAVTGLRFRRGGYVEAEAAHIIGKEARGPDDPRNGLALSRTAHWAFDHGIFTLSDDYEVTIHDRARDGDQRLAPLFEAEGRQILLPNESFYRPHPEAWPGIASNVSEPFCASEGGTERGAFLNEINYMGTSEFSTRLA